MKVTVFGGGNGLSTVLQGLSRWGPDSLKIAAVVAMSDDGNSSGALRRQNPQAPAWGDVRRSIVALSPLPEAARLNLIGPDGHKLGNLQLHRSFEQFGCPLRAIETVAAAYKVSGQILPATLASADLQFRLASGRTLVGESAVPEQTIYDPIRRVRLVDRFASATPVATPAVLAAIEAAELIILGPGSLWTSVIASILAQGIDRAFSRTKAPILYIANASTERGETQGYSLGRHLRVLRRYVGHQIDTCLVNNRITERGRNEAELGNIRHLTTWRQVIGGTRIIQTDLVDVAAPLYHDRAKLGQALVRLLAIL